MRKLILVSVFIAASTAAQNDPVSRSWNQPVQPFQIIGNIYYVGASDVTSFLIASKKGHVLLDAGFEETAPMIRANIETLGFRLQDVRVLLSTHAHFDHAGGLAEIKRLTGAPFFASAGDVPLYARGGRDDPQFGDRFPFPGMMADRVIEDGERVTVGASTFTAHMTPGHTRGCTTWTTTVEGLDVVFLCSPTVPTGYRIIGNSRYPDAIADYRKHFAVLNSLPCDVFLGSHGSFFDLQPKRSRLVKGETRAFVDPEGCRRFIAAMERRFEALARE